MESKKPKVINFIGPPSVGKSVMSSLLYAELKMMHLKVEYVQEIAKKLIYEDRLEELNCQYNLSNDQYKIIKAVSSKVDYTITDSGIFLNLFYNRQYSNNICNVEKVEEIFKEKLNEFNNIYILLERNNDFPFEVEGRVHNEVQSKKLAQEIEKMVIEYQLPYKKVKSCRESIKEIIQYILN
jgi:nicotinamide riboside kinase